MAIEFVLCIEHPNHVDQQSLISIISNLGVDFVSTVQESSFRYSAFLSGQSNNLEFSEKQDWGVGYYLLHEGRDGFFSHNDFTRSTSEIIDIANSLVRHSNNPKNTNHLEYDEDVETNVSVIDILENSPWYTDPEEQIDEYLNEITYHLTNYKHRIGYNIQINGGSFKKTIQNSEDINILQRHDLGLMAIEIYLKKDPSFGYTSQFGGLQRSDFNLDYIISQLEKDLQNLTQMEKATKIRSNQTNLVLSPDSSYSLIHETIGHGAEADQIIMGNSFLANKIGYKVASSNVTITDDPHLRGVGWSEYDDEGTKTKGTLLVEDGILVDFLHTRQTAQLLDSPTTGNARATSYYEKPEARQTNLFIEPKDNSLEEILEDVDEGYLLGPTRFASTSIFSGEIQIETHYGQEIRDGELYGFVKPCSVKGNALDLLSKIKLVGNELIKQPTECLKLKSRINIGAYTPFMSLEGIHLD